jgi:diketogulonate reductase-like aldo/keto reductase
MPALGLGTWRMGEDASERAAELAALKAGLDAGIGMIDTAEMYGEGGAEEIVREAIAGRRDSVFIVSKVLPQNASSKGTIAACERSLKRLGTDRIDLYLLHWPGPVPLAETVPAFEALVTAGKIGRWGVSNFGVEDMVHLAAVPSRTPCATNQVLYHLGERGIEWQLLQQSARAGIPIMAYSPLGQGAILKHNALKEIADRHSVTPAAVAIAWTLRRPDLISIPKTARAERVAEIAIAGSLVLDAGDLARLDKAFPPPAMDVPLAML